MPYSICELDCSSVTQEIIAPRLAPSRILTKEICGGVLSVTVVVLGGVPVFIQPNWKASTKKMAMPTTNTTSEDSKMGLVVRTKFVTCAVSLSMVLTGGAPPP